MSRLRKTGLLSSLTSIEEKIEEMHEVSEINGPEKKMDQDCERVIGRIIYTLGFDVLKEPKYIYSNLERLRYLNRVALHINPASIQRDEENKKFLKSICHNKMAVRLLGREILGSMLREYQFEMNDVIHSIIILPWHVWEMEVVIKRM